MAKVSRFVATFLPTSKMSLRDLLRTRDLIIMTAHRGGLVNGFSVDAKSDDTQIVLKALAKAINAHKDTPQSYTATRRGERPLSPLGNKTASPEEKAAQEKRRAAKSAAMAHFRKEAKGKAGTEGCNVNSPCDDAANHLSQAERDILGL
jgi:hypothetical protein